MRILSRYYEDEELSCVGPRRNWNNSTFLKAGRSGHRSSQQEDMSQGQGPARVEGYNAIPLSPKPTSTPQEALISKTSCKNLSFKFLETWNITRV